jgi:predicted Fe-Mo cluster-binding NifX family protein
MKIAISTDGSDLEENHITTFCECDIFLIVDLKSISFKSVVNENKGDPSEVGGILGQLISNREIDAVITSEIGLQALDIFDRYKIKVYQAEGRIIDAIKQLEHDDRLPEISIAALKRYLSLQQFKNNE